MIFGIGNDCHFVRKPNLGGWQYNKNNTWIFVKTQIIKIAQWASNKILRKLQYGLMAASNGQTMVHWGF